MVQIFESCVLQKLLSEIIWLLVKHYKTNKKLPTCDWDCCLQGNVGCTCRYSDWYGSLWSPAPSRTGRPIFLPSRGMFWAWGMGWRSPPAEGTLSLTCKFPSSNASPYSTYCLLLFVAEMRENDTTWHQRADHMSISRSSRLFTVQMYC